MTVQHEEHAGVVRVGARVPSVGPWCVYPVIGTHWQNYAYDFVEYDKVYGLCV